MARTFVDDSYNYFDDNLTISSIKNKGLNIGEKVITTIRGALGVLNTPNSVLESYRTNLIKLRGLKNQLTMVRGTEVINNINAQITLLQRQIFNLENKFIGFFRDKQGAKNVINAVTSNPDLAITDNYVAMNFLNNVSNQSPNVVTPVPVVEIGYEQPLPAQQEPTQQGTEVVDKTIQSKKDNTLLYVGIGVIAVLLLTRK